MELMKAYIQQMKVENPEEYKKLMEGCGSESDMVDYITDLTKRAMKATVEDKKV